MEIGWPSSEEEIIVRKKNRKFLSDHNRKKFNFSRADQSRMIPEPPMQKPHDPEDMIIKLPTREDWSGFSKRDLADVIASRRSRRNFSDKSLTLEELSFLLWATQGIREPGMHFLRTVPSAGARHSFETYLAVNNLDDLDKGLYRYLPRDHSLLQMEKDEKITRKVAASSFGQMFIANSAVVFIWTTIPYRMEWRYGPAAHRVIGFDIGHVCQNLYLTVEAIGGGTCAIGAYDQDKMDELIRVDGKDEYVIYMAPVGKI